MSFCPLVLCTKCSEINLGTKQLHSNQSQKNLEGILTGSVLRSTTLQRQEEQSERQTCIFMLLIAIKHEG